MGDDWLFLREKELALKWSNEEVVAEPNASSFWSRGESYEMNGDFENAIDDYQTAWEFDPAYIYLIAKARSYMKVGQREKAANEFCKAICDINHRCDNGIMKYASVFKYELLKSRLLACPPYLEPCGLKTLQDISDIIEASKEHLDDKGYLSAKKILFWAIELDKQGKLSEKLVPMPLCGAVVQPTMSETETSNSE